MRRWLLENPGLKLLSLALAVFLWAVVLGEQKVEVSLNLPFELPIPSGMMVVNDAPETLAYECVIVGEQNANHGYLPSWEWWRG